MYNELKHGFVLSFLCCAPQVLNYSVNLSDTLVLRPRVSPRVGPEAGRHQRRGGGSSVYGERPTVEKRDHCRRWRAMTRPYAPWRQLKEADNKRRALWASFPSRHYLDTMVNYLSWYGSPFSDWRVGRTTWKGTAKAGSKTNFLRLYLRFRERDIERFSPSHCSGVIDSYRSSSRLPKRDSAIQVCFRVRARYMSVGMPVLTKVAWITWLSILITWKLICLINDTFNFLR